MSGSGGRGGGSTPILNDDIDYLKWKVEIAQKEVEDARKRLYAAQERAKKDQGRNERRFQQHPAVDRGNKSEQS